MNYSKKRISYFIMSRLTIRLLLIVASLNLLCVLVYFFGGRILQNRSAQPEIVIRHELGLSNPPKFPMNQVLSGVVFQGDGVSTRRPLLNTTVTVSLVHSFTPEIQRTASKIFRQYVREKDILALHPAILYRNGNLVTLTELKFEEGKQRMAAKDKVTYLFLRSYDRNFTVLDPEILLQVDFPSLPTSTSAHSPHLFQSADSIFLSFTAETEETQRVYFTTLDVDTLARNSKTLGEDLPPLDATEMAYIETPVGACLTPVFAHGHVNMIYSYDPFRLIQCSNVKGCEFFIKDSGTDVTDFGILRGGSPLELYMWPYYVGVTNAVTVVKETRKEVYTSHIFVMALDIPRILYISEPMSVHDAVRTVSFKDKMAAERYLKVSGIVLETEDSLAIAATVNDVANVMLRLTGLKPLLAEVIETDQMTSPKMRRNPPRGTVQRNVMEMIEEYLDTDITVS